MLSRNDPYSSSFLKIILQKIWSFAKPCHLVTVAIPVKCYVLAQHSLQIYHSTVLKDFKTMGHLKATSKRLHDHWWAEMGSNKVQIFRYCTQVDFSDMFTLLIFLCRFFTFTPYIFNTNICTYYSLHFTKLARYFSLP